MESIEQPFDSITRIGTEMNDTSDKAGLIETSDRSKRFFNGDSPGAENSPLHQGKTTNNIIRGSQNRGLRVIIISSVVFAVAVTVALVLTIYLEPKQVHGHAAVSCEDVRCSEVGLRILRQGGNAVDATVATAFCLGVVNPAHSGIGGGGLALVHDHKLQKSKGYNFREMAPTHLPDATGSEQVAASVGVPGMVRGLAEMHKAHGKLPWEDLLQPAIDLAWYGFHPSQELARALDNTDINNFSNENLKQIFLNDDHYKDINDTIVCPQLARSLKAVQSDPDSLYTGKLMKHFLKDIKHGGGFITEEDMRNYTVRQVPVLKTKFKDLTVIGLPPPASGATIALMLNMIEELDWKENQRNDSLTYHQLIEVYKFALAHRSYLGDPAFNVSMENITTHLTSPEFAAELVKKIDNNKTFDDEPTYYGPGFSASDSVGMSHISVIDSSELMVSTTLTMSSQFGSKIWLPVTGIWLNNAITDFTVDANDKKPGKNPLSSISPTVLYNQEHPCAYRFITGGSNGEKLLTGVVESIVNSVVFGMNLENAVSAPRVHYQLHPAETFHEVGIPAQVVSDLQDKGHNMVVWEVSENSSAVMSIEKTNDDIQAYADFRKFGKAVQY